MYLKRERQQAWRKAKTDLLLPIVYIRGFAMTGGEIEDTSSDPFNGFNVGSTLLRTSWTGASTRHIFESPVLRLSQPPYDYRVAFSDGLRGLDAETRLELRDWREDLEAQEGGGAALRGARTVLAIYRYYDAASKAFGDGVAPGMEAYGWGLGRLVLDLLEATGAPGVYLVAHSMGGLVARTFLQNPAVLDGSGSTDDEWQKRCRAVSELVKAESRLRITQEEWERARGAVRRLFTYGTPHNGITGQGGLGNGLLGTVDALLGFETGNFERNRMMEYLGRPATANSLGGHFPIRHTFCLVGTAASDYPVAAGFSRRLVGQLSDGLVEVDNAFVHGPPEPGSPATPSGTVLAARAYVRRAHSGPYGMVNSEEGFGNLSRFLFGDARVDGDLIVREIGLPQQLEEDRRQAQKRGEDDRVRASYSFETSLRLRGERWMLNERLARDGAAIFRRYEELLPEKPISRELKDRPGIDRDTEQHRRVELFSAFLDTQLRTLGKEPERVGGRDVLGTLGFAFRLRVAVPDYQLGESFWRRSHYEGSALLDQDFVFLAFQEGEAWNLAWGPNSADGTNDQLRIVTDRTEEEPGVVPQDDRAWRRDVGSGIEFWLPVRANQPPVFNAWLRLTAQHWNQRSSPS